MASDTVVRSRIDGRSRRRPPRFSPIWAYAIRPLLVRVAAERALPFAIKVPNAETRAAIAEFERGRGASVRRHGQPNGRSEGGRSSRRPMRTRLPQTDGRARLAVGRFVPQRSSITLMNRSCNSKALVASS